MIFVYLYMCCSIRLVGEALVSSILYPDTQLVCIPLSHPDINILHFQIIYSTTYNTSTIITAIGPLFVVPLNLLVRKNT